MNESKFGEFRLQPASVADPVRESAAPDPEVELAREVIALRTTLRLTQKELADRVGTSQPAISRFESGKYRKISLAFIRRLGDALGAVPEVHLRERNVEIGAN